MLLPAFRIDFELKRLKLERVAPTKEKNGASFPSGTSTRILSISLREGETFERTKKGQKEKSVLRLPRAWRRAADIDFYITIGRVTGVFQFLGIEEEKNAKLVVWRKNQIRNSSECKKSI